MSLLEKNTWRLATSLFSRLTSLLSFIFLQLFSSHCYYIHFVLLDFIWNYLVFSSPGWSLRKLRQITRGKQHFLFSSIKKNKQIVVWGFIIFFVLFVSVLVLFPPLIFLSKSLIIPPPQFSIFQWNKVIIIIIIKSNLPVRIGHKQLPSSLPASSSRPSLPCFGRKNFIYWYRILALFDLIFIHSFSLLIPSKIVDQNNLNWSLILTADIACSHTKSLP